MSSNFRLLTTALAVLMSLQTFSQPLLPSEELLGRPFCKEDRTLFENPQRVFYPEVWIDCLCGNLSREGIKADLEAIDEAGFSGVQMFFGNRGGAWPGVKQILSLSPEWEDFVRYAAQKADSLGLRFTLQNCPGWAMAGGPWITPDKAMRHLVWTSTSVSGGSDAVLPVPPESSTDWRDYEDLMVLAFRTPLGESQGGLEYSVTPQILGTLAQTSVSEPHIFEITLEKPESVRTVEFSSVQLSNHWFCYDPGIHGKMEAVYADASVRTLFDADWPQSNWQDDRPLSLACDEAPPTDRYRLTIANVNGAMGVSSFRLLSAARKNGWESEAAWSLRSILRNNDHPDQDKRCWVGEVLDLTEYMDSDGRLHADLPEGDWTVLRIGNVNTGKKNAPAPPEATGFECDKLSTEGADSHFAGYVGKLAAQLPGGLLDGMLMDSWECETQTWTDGMEAEFKRAAGYDLRPWIPALMGYVVVDPETTSRFLRDWRSVINDLVVNNFYGKMAENAHAEGLTVTYETAGGDVFPSDIMEYFKYADLPMCEFWVHDPEIFVGTFNFKPIRPTASAAHLYGKPGVACEAFTSMQQTWDEQLSVLRRTANKNFIHGVSYLIYQAYTHNPAPDRLVPGSSFGDGIGTPFLRAQTWWPYMHDFNDCMARTSFMLERGKPVVDVLWYLGDEIDHKPDQNAPFPSGYRYDYCNPDVLLNRLSVKDGRLETPEGLSYSLLWLPESHRFVPETVEKMLELVRAGAVIVGNAPEGLATLKDQEKASDRLSRAVEELWGNGSDEGVRTVGKGRVLSGCTIEEALNILGIHPDLVADGLLWLHRETEGADWYYVCPEPGKTFSGEVTFDSVGSVELWDPVTGRMSAVPVLDAGPSRTTIALDLARDEACFIVVGKSARSLRNFPGKTVGSIVPDSPWTLTVPQGWGLDAPVSVSCSNTAGLLSPLKDLDIPEEARAFSGTVTYSTTFRIGKKDRKAKYLLDLGRVEQAAGVTVNGREVGSVWTEPYCLDITSFIRRGENTLTVEVTNTWFNRLAYDSGLDEAFRKTWTTNYPPAGSPLRDSGLVGPVNIFIKK